MLRRASAPIWLTVVVLAGASTSSCVAAQATVDARVAATMAIARPALTEWLGPGRLEDIATPGAPLFDSPGTMAVESRVAYALARRRFAHLGGDDARIADGMAWYLQSRVVEVAFDRAFLRPGYRFQTICFFGCTVPRPVPLIVNRWSDGVGRPEYLRSTGSRGWPALDRRVPDGFAGEAVRGAMLFASLERELGWPALQGALRVVAEARDDRRVADILAAATARPLQKAFALALGPQPIDYAVSEVTSAARTCNGSPCVLTRVALARSSELPYPLTLRLDFADRSTVSTYWNGEDALEFESAAAVSAVSLDAGRAWLLDADLTNNDYQSVRATNVAVTKFVARWVTWLQDAMLTYSFPI